MINENGKHFVYFCSFNHIVIGGSLFHHKRIHKATWTSSDHHRENLRSYHHHGRKITARHAGEKGRCCFFSSPSSGWPSETATQFKRFVKSTTKPSQRYHTTLLKDAATRDKFKLEISNRKTGHDHPLESSPTLRFIIRLDYQPSARQVIRPLTDQFPVLSGVRQEGMLSPFLFLLVID